MLTTKAKEKLHNDVTNNETIHYLLQYNLLPKFETGEMLRRIQRGGATDRFRRDGNTDNMLRMKHKLVANAQCVNSNGYYCL